MKQLKYLVIFLFTLGLLVFNSCLSNSVTDYSDDARVYTFSISNDSVPAFAKRTFTVDQTNNIIYNADSLPYKTKLYGNFKAVPSITTYSSAAMFFNDTVYTSGDSIDFRWKHTFKNYAENGTTYKTYDVDVRMHKVEPDSIAWEKRTYPYSSTITDEKALLFDNYTNLYVNSGSSILRFTTDRAISWSSYTVNGLPLSTPLRNMVAFKNGVYVINNGTLYASSDGSNWNAISISSSYTLKSLICSYDSKLFAVAYDSNNNYYVVTSTDGTTWSVQYAVNNGVDGIENGTNNGMSNGAFPISDYAATSFTPGTGTAKMLIVGGKDANGNTLRSVYSYQATSNKWIDLSTEIPTDSFSVRKNAALTWYDDRCMMYGGTDGSNSIVKDTLLCSKTEGYLWTRNDTLVNFPEVLNYKLRTKASVVVDNESRILLIGGIDGNGNYMKDAWVGRKNKLGFGKSSQR
ncbi:MAG: hypothetical protein H6Q17_629 [Bacteroidetes bacterium]|nr:hypothetical protein [Bacteroidota bacterium]